MRPFDQPLRHPFFLLSLLLLAFIFGPAASAQQGGPPAAPPEPPVRPELVFQDGAVEVQGLTPGGDVVLFGVARRALGYHQRVERVDEVLTADATGFARFELSDGVAPTAVWAVIDLSTGTLAAGPTPGFARQVRPFPTAGLHGRGGLPGSLVQSLEAAQILYVRPGEGAWGAALLDGNVYDRDGADNGSFELALEDLVPVGPETPLSPPVAISAGDVIVVVDSTNLSLFTLRVTPDAVR